MSNTYELLERIQKDYDYVDKCVILDENGVKMVQDLKEEDKKKNASSYSNNYTDIPKLFKKSISVVRDMNPLNELSFLQVSYSGIEYLITQDEDLYVFTAINTSNKK
jgi:hypothetical protein